MASWLDESTEVALVKGLRDRAPTAAEALVRLFLAKLIGIAHAWDLQDADAQSVAFEALMKVVRGIDSFATQPGASFRSWVFRIMLNCLKDFVKRRKRLREHEVGTDTLASGESIDEAGEILDGTTRQHIIAASPSHEEPVSASPLMTAVASTLLESMSPRERAVITRTADGMSDPDIAAELRISRTAVRAARSRARSRAGTALAQITPTLDETIYRKLRKLLD